MAQYTLNFCNQDFASAELVCFLENYGCHEVDFGVKMTARPFSTIHLLMDQFIERDFAILFLLL